MNELQTTIKQLPDTIEELSNFVFMGREQLTALKAAIRACKKSDVLSGKLTQMKEEQQLLAENVLIAEMRIGELLQEVPKAKNQYDASDNAVGSTQLQKARENIGINERTAQRYQTLAKHPDLVEQAIEEARKQDRAVTRQEALNKIYAEEVPTVKQRERRELAEAMESQRQIQEALKSDDPVSFETAKQFNENYKVFAKNLESEIFKIFVKTFKLSGWRGRDLKRIAQEIDESKSNEIINRINGAIAVLTEIREEMLNAKRQKRD